MKNLFFLIVGLIIILGSVFLFLEQRLTINNSYKVIKINDTDIKVEIANTPEMRQKGLSGRKELSYGTGMFFIFENPDKHGFWMKDMNFAIDIVWIDEKFNVVGVEKQVSPETFPQIFYPNQEVKYVLELPAGFTDKYRIYTGQYVTI